MLIADTRVLRSTIETYLAVDAGERRRPPTTARRSSFVIHDPQANVSARVERLPYHAWTRTVFYRLRLVDTASGSSTRVVVDRRTLRQLMTRARVVARV